MDIWVFSKDLVALDILDSYKSLVWTNRYSSCGDFELITSVNSKNLASLVIGNFLMIKSHSWMIIEAREIKSDVETGTNLILTGRSLSSILEKRIVWPQTILNGNMQSELIRLVTINAISPTVLNRKIERLVFAPSSNPLVLGYDISTQYTGDTLLKVMEELCSETGLGFGMDVVDYKFQLYLYAGEDRTQYQLTNPYVLFSPRMDNVISSNHFTSLQGAKTVAMILGEGEGTERESLVVDPLNLTDLDRNELYVDARDLSRTTDEGELDIITYQSILEERGYTELYQNRPIEIFDSSVDDNAGQYKYGRDYSLGDVVQNEDEHGNFGTTRIEEVILSVGENATKIYPVFVKI